MPSFRSSLAGVTGPGRRARWRRSVVRRLLSAACLVAAVLAVVEVVRPPPPPTVSVVVARHPVPAGSVLRPDDLGAAAVPVAVAQPGALTAAGSAVGRRVGSALAAGETVTATRLVPRTVTEGLEVGRVALHLPLADPAAADLLAPGQRVGVYPAEGGAVLAGDAVVLAVDPPVADPVAALAPVGGSPRGVVLTLPGDSADRVLASRGDTGGVVAVVVVARPG